MMVARTQVQSDGGLYPLASISLSERAEPEGRLTFLLTVALFLCTYFVFCISPIINTSDSMYSMVLSESILRRNSTNLNEYQFPERIAELRTSAPPIDDPRNPHTYQRGK